MRRIPVAFLFFALLVNAQTKTPTSPATGKQAPPAASGSAKQAPATAAPAQKSAPAAQSAAPAQANPASVPPEAAIITIKGMCAKPGASPCELTVTRSQFERLIDAITPRDGLAPPVNATAKRQMATVYARTLALYTEGTKRGVDKTPEAQELAKFATMQAVAQSFVNQLQQSSAPTDAEVQKYYQENQSRYQQATVRRVTIVTNPASDAKNVTPESLKKLGQQLYQRAKAGEDPDKLQKEAYQAAGYPNPPDTKLVLLPTSLPPSQQSVFQLKPGEVSQYFDEPSGSAMFYKMEKIEAIPFEKVKQDIQRTLHQQKFQSSMESLVSNVKPELNETYFGATSPAAPAAQRPPQEPDPDEKR